MLVMVSGASWGQSLLVDDFTGTSGTLLTANGWVAHSGTGTGPMSVAIPGLTYSGYLSSGVGNATSASGNSEDINKAFTSANSGSVYYSFMINASPTITSGDYSFHFCQTSGASAGGFYGRFFIQKDATSNLRFGISKFSSTASYTGYTYATGTTYLIVVKYTFNTGSTTDDAVALFVNPVAGAAEPAATVSVTTETTADATTLAAIAIRQWNAGTLARFDGIRVGLTWADVTPATAGCTPPATQATSSASTSITSNSATANWSIATVGENALVVARLAATTAVAPANGTSYTANAAFGSGAITGTGNFVVYNGNGSNVTITGLAVGTNYVYDVYEYNTTGNCYLSPASSQSFTTLTAPCTAPSAVSSVAYSAVTGTSMTGTITPVTATGYLVFYSTTQATPPVITDATVYDGSNTPANYTFVQSGAGTTFNLSGLSSATTYNVFVFSYNSGGCSGGPAYAVANTSSQATLANCTTPSPVASVAYTTLSDRISGTITGSGSTGYTIFYSASNTVAPALADATPYNAGNTPAGYSFVYSGTSTTFSITGLTPNTTYYVFVFAYNNTLCYGGPKYSTSVDNTLTTPAPTTGAIKISQVYGGGNNSGATYQYDYVELYNPTSSPVIIDGWSVQYGSATSATGNMSVGVLSGTIQPGRYYLVQCAGGTTNGVPLPVSPDATNSINMSATSGKILLYNGASPLVISASGCPTVPLGYSIIDLVGFGSPNCSETAPAPAPSNTTGIYRKLNGCQDSEDNSSDFYASDNNAMVPRNSSKANSCNTLVTTSTMTAFTTVTTLVSAEQYFAVSGTSLLGTVTVTPPTGYSVSLTAGGPYTSSVTITPEVNTGNLALTAVYIVLNSGANLSAGTYNGNVTVESTGATTQNVAVTGTVNPCSGIGWGNLQSPASGNICPSGTYTAYGRVYKAGVTEPAGAPAGITAELGYSTTNSDPSTWTNWQPATFNTQYGNDDEFMSTLSGLLPGTYYYAFRYQVSPCSYQYGGYSAPGGGFWNGSNYISGVLTVTGTSNLAATTCQNDINIGSTGTMFNDVSCNPIARVVPSGASPVSGLVNSCVTVDAAVQSHNGSPYLQRHFDIEPQTNAATATGTVTLYVLQSEFDAYNLVRGAQPALPTSGSNADPNISNIRITQYHGTGTAPGNYSGAAVLLTPTSVNWNGNYWEITVTVTGFSGFYVHSSIGGVLPINLLTFSGQKQGSVNKLNWTTVSEQNNRGFAVERSADGVNYAAIGFVNSLAVNGNSDASLTYSFTDANPTDSKQYYRLRQQDINGVSRLSNVIVIKGEKVNTLTIDGLYPNPVSSQLNVAVSSPVRGTVTLQVVDMTGRILSQQVKAIAEGSNTVSLNVDVFLMAVTY